MKCWTSLLMGALSVELAILAGVALLPPASPAEMQTQGTAYVTQLSNMLPSADYDSSFGDNWQSVRTFRLLSPLDKPLKVYVEHRPKLAGLFQAHYEDYVLDGLNQWSNALDNRLRFSLTNKQREADITIDWVPTFADRYVAGLTTYSVGHASVEIKTVGIPDKDIKCNIIHELGHALGISGHSTNAGDVMVGMRKWHRDNMPYDPKLSSRDTQAIRRLYSLSWQKGEDLFSSDAQRMPILANNPTNPTPRAGTQDRFKISSTGSSASNSQSPSQLAQPLPIVPVKQTEYTASAQTRTMPTPPEALSNMLGSKPLPMPALPRYTQIFPKP